MAQAVAHSEGRCAEVEDRGQSFQSMVAGAVKEVAESDYAGSLSGKVDR